MDNQVIIACGTDDGVGFTSDHFGSAKYYLIYTFNLQTGEIGYREKIVNTSRPEEIHGDPKKARSVTELLREAQVLMGKVMGPNIVRMRKKFIPVICRDKNIVRALEKRKVKTAEIQSNLELPPGQDRKIIYLNQQQ